jgi:hypothetical protein
MRIRPVLGLIVAALPLQGCVAAVLPLAAAGMIGKTQVDKAQDRAKRAEASVDAAPPPVVTVGDAVPAVSEPPAPEAPGTPTLLERLDRSDFTNAYLPFARYAIDQAARQQRGGTVRSAVLVDQVSLLTPKTLSCDGKPMLAVIDVDVAPGTPAEMDVERQSGFAEILDSMRESEIRIAWLADADEAQLKPILDLLREGETPAMRDADLMLFGQTGGYRKQERRWQLARDHCVVAIAGDRKADFDELYEYLRDQNYAIRLEAFMGRGWFELPHPVAAIDSERLEISNEKQSTPEQPDSSEQKVDQ